MASRISRSWFNASKDLDMPAVAITDHGTMFGVIDFYKAATNAGVKPIIGLEAYMAARTHERPRCQTGPNILSPASAG